jgi:hypothetical protein
MTRTIDRNHLRVLTGIRQAALSDGVTLQKCVAAHVKIPGPPAVGWPNRLRQGNGGIVTTRPVGYNGESAGTSLIGCDLPRKSYL